MASSSSLGDKRARDDGRLNHQNAFSVLMSSSKKAKARQYFNSLRTQFVQCPAGCGKRLLEKEMNDHLDKCIIGGENQGPPKSTATESMMKLAQSKKRSPPCSSLSIKSKTKKSIRLEKRTQFVCCPAGCGKRMLGKEVNQHLDQCLGVLEKTTEKRLDFKQNGENDASLPSPFEKENANKSALKCSSKPRISNVVSGCIYLSDDDYSIDNMEKNESSTMETNLANSKVGLKSEIERDQSYERVDGTADFEQIQSQDETAAADAESLQESGDCNDESAQKISSTMNNQPESKNGDVPNDHDLFDVEVSERNQSAEVNGKPCETLNLEICSEPNKKSNSAGENIMIRNNANSCDEDYERDFQEFGDVELSEPCIEVRDTTGSKSTQNEYDHTSNLLENQEALHTKNEPSESKSSSEGSSQDPDSGTDLKFRIVVVNNTPGRSQPSPQPKKVADEGSGNEQNRIQVKPGRKERKPSNNAFSLMMHRSKTLYSAKKAGKQKIQHFLHLNSDCSLSLYTHQEKIKSDELLQKMTTLCWSATINMKDKSQDNIPGSAMVSPTEIELTVSSSIPSYVSSTSHRLVKKHSRLSVPVLKSILQKTVRRRRPLPAVRVAMELCDKALEELLRRLPIIVLEDSTLHPDLDFLVWLMVAHSKDFVPSPNMISKLLQVVFEIASCQWQDKLIDKETNQIKAMFWRDFELLYSDSESTSSRLSSVIETEKRLIMSMLIRAQYGGMKCDVEMLRSYAALWGRRFTSANVPNDVATKICIGLKQKGESKDDNMNGSNKEVSWNQVPMIVHERPKTQSLPRVVPLCTNGIERLYFEDISVEGIDFHCSNIIQNLMSDKKTCEDCFEFLSLIDATFDGDDGKTGIPSSPEGRRSWLESFVKRCMWNFSSGVNRRRSLLTNECSDVQDKFSGIWNDLFAKKAKTFQSKYVEERLAV